MVNRKIKIVVACGAAIAQSSMLQMMISSYLDKKKVNYEIQKCTFYELQNKVNSWNPISYTRLGSRLSRCGRVCITTA